MKSSVQVESQWGSNPAPKTYSRVMQALRQGLVAGTYQPGERLPSQAILTKRYGVSQPTLQRAINLLVEEGFLVSKPRVGVYVHDHPPHISRYALILPRPSRVPSHITSRFFDSLFHVAATHNEQAIDGIEFKAINLPIGVEEKRIANKKFNSLCHEIEQHRFAGLIYAGGVRVIMNQPSVRDSGIPQVILGAKDLQYHSVALDHEAFLKMAAQYIHEQGRTRLAVISMAGSSARQVINQSVVPIKIPPRWSHAIHIDNAEAAVNLMRLLLHGDEANRPDALLITDDNLTEYVLAGVLAKGLSVPDDLLIVSHANFAIKPRPLIPVTYLGYDTKEILSAAVRVCRQAKQQADVSPITKWIMPHFDLEPSSAVSED